METFQTIGAFCGVAAFVLVCVLGKLVEVLGEWVKSIAREASRTGEGE